MIVYLSILGTTKKPLGSKCGAVTLKKHRLVSYTGMACIIKKNDYQMVINL